MASDRAQSEENQKLLASAKEHLHAYGLSDQHHQHEHHQHHLITSRLRVANLCCVQEEKIIRETLLGMPGIEKVSVSLVNRSVIIQHCDVNACTPTEKLVEVLNEKHLGVSIHETSQETGAEEATLPILHILQIITLWVLVIVAIIFNLIEDDDDDDDDGDDYIYCIVIVVGINSILQGLYRAIVQRTVTIQVLMFLALCGALARGQYFDASFVVTLFASGELAETLIMHHVRNVINRSVSGQPDEVTMAEGAKKALSEIKVGDVIAMRAGDIIMLDGVVIKGEAAIDESSVTGEPTPITKQVGSTVVSGSLVQNGFVEVEVTVEASNGTMTKIRQIIEDIEAEGSTYGGIVDMISSYWGPGILTVIGAFVLLGRIESGSWDYYLEESLVLMILSCPCSLILATPIPTACAVVKGIQNGVLIRNLAAIEDVAQVEKIALDKTGTLTTGQFRVCEQQLFDEDGHLTTFDLQDEDNPMRLAAAVENYSSHPLANAVISAYLDCVADFEGDLPKVRKFQVVPGKGLSGWVEVDSDWKYVQIGNERLLESNGGDVSVADIQEQQVSSFVEQHAVGKALIYIAIEGQLSGLLSLADQLRYEAKAFIQQLHDDNRINQVVMLTGDTSEIALSVAKDLGVDLCNVYSRLYPIDKLSLIRQMETGSIGGTEIVDLDPKMKLIEKRGDDDAAAAAGGGGGGGGGGGRVMMIGDGMNDSPSLAAASVGVAMGSNGAAISVAAAQVILMSENLLLIPATKELCHFTCRIIIENCVLAILLKLVALLVGMISSLSLWEAMLFDIGTMLIVLLNGIRPLYCGVYELIESS